MTGYTRSSTMASAPNSPRLGRGARLHQDRHHWSKRYWPVIDVAEKLSAKSFIIDGEMIAAEPDGRPNFHAMHSRMAWKAELLAFVAFDIMHLDGQDLRVLPAIERKAMLWDLVKPATGIIQYSQHVEGNGAEFCAAADKIDLEGIVSKRLMRPITAARPVPGSRRNAGTWPISNSWASSATRARSPKACSRRTGSMSARQRLR
ncbi:RNA ligase family protein [Mesorhizobium sp. SARCC-RB16n]|uniref:ATP-dependent DNA ligase n=1 Tax=Mesorhizobium sp. SARCC-RB16n TaxID=2116687 RepID=UPI001FEFA340|nr:RNA ligase family protein [Mesorhizobium sp. SARCC-RB16n]